MAFELELLIVPVATTFIGWITNVVAVKMLFHPQKPINLGFMSLQGVVPKRQKKLAASLAEIIEKELVSVTDLTAKFDAIDLEKELDPVVDRFIEGLLKRIIGSIPMAGMFLQGGMGNQLKVLGKQELVKFLPELKEMISKKMHAEYDLRGFIEERIASFSLDKLEEIVMHVARKELRTIEVLGGVLGLLIGLLQMALMYWL
jgi:uncharacterized membrane protein YheB (UPF0754 family)